MKKVNQTLFYVNKKSSSYLRRSSYFNIPSDKSVEMTNDKLYFAGGSDETF